jgi:hypothetical protein
MRVRPPFLSVVCLILGVLIAPGRAAGQTPAEFPPGRLTGSIVSTADPSQRYAVYLPSSYNAATKHPVLFVMDYRGRARTAANVFIEAAERFGWIIVSSSNSVSDETPLPTVKALQAMWKDAYDRFPIDEKRIYLAGLSGTARTATWVASQVPGSIAGVIGAAAGFAPLSPPSSSTKFLYFGTVGDVDYNYWEMRQLESRLNELQLHHRVEYFSGTHGWMPPRLAMRAIEWMELRAMRAGLREVDRTLIDGWWWRDLHAAEYFEEAGQELSAAFRLHAVARDYAGLRSAAQTGDVAARIARLNVNPLVSAGVRAREEGAARHAARIADAMQLLADVFPKGAKAAAEPAEKTIERLGIPTLVQTAAGPIPSAALDARRALAELDVQTGFYLPVEALQAGDDARAAFYLEIQTAIDANDPFTSFLRGKILARAGQHSEAIDALRRAVQLGFRSVDLIDADKAFEPLRPRADYQAILDEVRASWEDRPPRKQ